MPLTNDRVEYTLREIEERSASISRNITSGSCKSYEEYKGLCGQLRGLELARSILSGEPQVKTSEPLIKALTGSWGF